jgi:Ca2+-transporting ATPase
MSLHGLLAGLTLAMAILPEELPVMLVIFLGLGAWRLAQQKVLTRRVPAIETLGAATVLCVDKTGTSDPMERAIRETLQRLLASTEHYHPEWELVDEYPLSPELLAMSRVWRSTDRRAYAIAAKGAPEAIVDLCHLPAEQRDVIAARVTALAAGGLRVLGVAKAVCSVAPLPDHQHAFEFEYLGLLGLADPSAMAIAGAVARGAERQTSDGQRVLPRQPRPQAAAGRGAEGLRRDHRDDRRRGQ